MLKNKENIFFRNVSLFIIIFYIFVLFSYPVLAQYTCGDGILEPGEYCDPGGPSNPKVFFDGINNCNQVSTNWASTALNCNSGGGAHECQLDVTLCGPPISQGQECRQCRECNNRNSPYGRECRQNECINFCPGYGSCTFNPVGTACNACSTIARCEDYRNEFDCNFNICVTNPNMGNKICEWIGGTCKENLDCTWNCDNLYNLNSPNPQGMCPRSGICNLIKAGNDPVCSSTITTECLTSTDPRVISCLNKNPTNSYPPEIYCAELEEDFPIFTGFNIALSIILLVGYYIAILKKKNFL